VKNKIDLERKMVAYQPEKIHNVMLKLSGEILAGPTGYGF
jgi:hypothetical protein